MKRAGFLAIILLLSLVGITWAQTTTDEPLFVPLRQIGESRPRGILYDPHFDRFAWVDAQQRLLLVDATTNQPQHVLYQSGAYNAYQFSHDGRWLALAIDRRIELWDTQSGERVAQFESTGANLVQGPLHFTPDDKYLLLDSVVPAPPALRRSENDTSIIPWLWDLEAARGERSSRYASAEDGYAFFEYRNGLVVGANTMLIGGIPNRLMVIDGAKRSFPVVAEIRANRFERDPIIVWQSATDDLLYADPRTNEGIVQVDTQTGSTFPIPLGRDLNYSNLAQLEGLQIANNGRELCPTSGRVEPSLLRLIYGAGYLNHQNYEPRTFMLLDVLVPMTMAQDRGALLIYNFNPQRGRGSIELIRPPDIQQMMLSPDRTRLVVRRASGDQPIERYNLEDCTLERTIYPAEADGSGRHNLAFNADGSVIVSDFQRFDTDTGATLAHAVNYTQGFEAFFFGEDSRTVATIRAGTWQSWDVASGQPLQRTSIRLNGTVIDQSADASRYLTRSDRNSGVTIEITDLKQNTRQTLDIPARPGQSIEQIIYSEDWQHFIVVYSPPQALHPTGNEVAVYSFDVGLRFFVAGDDLPADSRQYGWLDARTIYAAGTQYGGQPERVYGIDYHPSGLPACLTHAFPDDYDDWLLLWEAFSYRMGPDRLNRLAARLCDALPASADDVPTALTPTAAFAYRSNPTPRPYNIPGVPQCLTERFSREATAYAALWRDISSELDDDQRAELEVMICEGLIGSVSAVQPTPTINPNAQEPPTPTPIEGAPQTTGGGAAYRPRVIAIDIETQQRTEGDYLPPSSQKPPPDPGILLNFFADQFNRSPRNLQVSPDGQLVAELDPNGFVTLYRLSRSFADLLAEEASAQATRQAQEARSIGLIPTATESFHALGEIRPTLTPTITPTPLPLAQTTPDGWQNDAIEAVCPARHLFSLENQPPGYAAVGRLFAAPPAAPDAIWVLRPVDGRLAADDSLPRCGLNEDCRFSFDGQWVLRLGNRLIVSRPDGSQATVLSDNPNYFPHDFTWLPDNRLRYRYSGYLPAVFRGRGDVLRDFDPATGILSDPFAPPDLIHRIQVGELPTTVIANQPGGDLMLVRTPYGTSGDKYYIYDRETGTATYFARTERNPMSASWHPLGHMLYYAARYAYDVQAERHYRLPGGLPGGIWSPNGRYRMRWFSQDPDDRQVRIAAGDLPLKLERWDAQTGARRRYCLPETGTQTYGANNLVWSPDGRYVAFTITLPIDGDTFPTPGPTPVPYTRQPTRTPVPLADQYDIQFSRTIVFDTETGYATVISTDIRSLILWTNGGGAP